MIAIMPEGGLCNRLRAVASANVLARRLQTQLQIDWYLTTDLNSRLECLFELAQPDIEVRQFSCRSPSGRLAWRGRELVRRATGWKVVVLHVERDTAYFRELAERKWPLPRKLYLRTCYQILAEPGMYSLFRPSAAVDAVLQSYGEDLGSAVGVHIRRTDNRRAVKSGPLSKFIELMDAECERGEQIRFFIASDDPLVLQDLIGRYGKRLVWHPKRSYRRDDPRAIFDAAVDLFCLSRCGKLIGSHWSAFTETAWQMRGIDHVIVGATS